MTVKDVRNEAKNMPESMKKVIANWTDGYIKEILIDAQLDGLNPIKVIMAIAISETI